MLLLTDLTSAPGDRSIGIEYCQKICEKVSPMPVSILHTKNIADTCTNTHKVLLIVFVAIPIYNLVDMSLLSWLLCKQLTHHGYSLKKVLTEVLRQ